ncbi:response regulator transcription factor [Azospirillum canadense]|uniref:response regulator transcription factor n=1 Tax=Azospirillum canadense TaxID=403962 RepID=UPI0022260EE9|nr:response regulator transcription factor [Azospirillum canadense]MCW2241645.1 two-component system response regulator ChvI [Azospirillum canadense]
MSIHSLPSLSLPNLSTARMAEAVARVALVEADEHYREALGCRLADEGYDVRSFDRGEAALEYLTQGGEADLVLLDWHTPGLAAAALLREANARGVSAPVICLAGEADDGDEHIALAHGARDYIGKSRRLPILLKRMALVLDGTKGTPSDVPAQAESEAAVHIRGDLELRLARGRALWKGGRVDLTLTEFNMIALLATRPEGDVSYRELYDLVHGQGFMAGYGNNGYRANVRAFIKRIRAKFRAVDAEFDGIANYPGFGYRWNSALAAQTGDSEAALVAT